MAAAMGCFLLCGLAGGWGPLGRPCGPAIVLCGLAGDSHAGPPGRTGGTGRGSCTGLPRRRCPTVWHLRSVPPEGV